MKFFRRHPFFSAIIALFVLLIALEAWYVHILRVEVATAEREVRDRVAEIERLERQKPAPIDENLRMAQADLEQNGEVLANMLRVLNVTGPDDLEFFKGEPVTRPDAWFEISQFVDRMTTEAGKAGVTLKPDERFGFSAYTFEGPEPTYIQGVYRQHRIVEYLLGKLFAARPRSLLAVQREEPLATPAPGTGTPGQPPSTAPAPVARAGASSGAGGGDIFAIDPQVSARTPGYVDTLAFRISFSGHTNALRGFMNALAAPEIPLVVRSVEVSAGAGGSRPGGGSEATGPRPPRNPFASTPATANDPQAASQAAVPIVAENASVFTVTVELFDVKIRAPKAAVTASNP